MSKPDDNLLWRRVATHFVVEMRVGNVWVEHSRSQVESDAKKASELALLEPAVREVRVCEHRIVHTNRAVHGAAQDTLLRVPAKMRLTSREQDCSRCGKPSPVAHDGATHWTFCSACQQAMPVA